MGRGLGVALLVMTACASAEPPREPTPVVQLDGLTLPPVDGGRPLPASFLGVVVTTDSVHTGAGPHARPRRVMLGVPSRPLDPELYDGLDAVLDGQPPGTEVIWFIDQRVPLSTAASALYVGSRLGLDTFWLASGSVMEPTIHAAQAGPFGGPARGGAPERYAADLRLELGPRSMSALAEPRAVDDRPGFPVLDAHLAPGSVRLRLEDSKRCAWSSPPPVRKLGRALCAAQGPFALTLDVDPAVSYTALIQRLASDPRPARCVTGPVRLSIGAYAPKPSCAEAVTVDQLPARFAADAKAQADRWLRPREDQ